MECIRITDLDDLDFEYNDPSHYLDENSIDIRYNTRKLIYWSYRKRDEENIHKNQIQKEGLMTMWVK